MKTRVYVPVAGILKENTQFLVFWEHARNNRPRPLSRDCKELSTHEVTTATDVGWPYGANGAYLSGPKVGVGLLDGSMRIWWWRLSDCDIVLVLAAMTCLLSLLVLWDGWFYYATLSAKATVSAICDTKSL